MRYLALASDYDGTLATYGQVSENTLDALLQLQSSGRKLILVTGRELEDLLRVFPYADIFDSIVAENGAVLYDPRTREEKVLAERPPEAFLKALDERAVKPLSVGRAVVSTMHPHEIAVLEAIRELGLELQVIFNKGAVMVLPAGVNKATGLSAALAALGLSPHNVVAVGDGENDHAFLRAAQCGIAVAGAVPMLKETADWVTEGDAGKGVEELIACLIEEDLDSIDRETTRNRVLLGTAADGAEITFPALGTSLLISGPSGSGKSTSATAIMERLTHAGYQICIMDPEGDYQGWEHGVVLGSTHQPPAEEELVQLLQRPDANLVVNMLAVPLEERPAFFGALLPRIQALRGETGRPHWLVIDEAHHLLHTLRDPGAVTLPEHFDGLLLITVHPNEVSQAVLKAADIVLAVGDRPKETLAEVAKGLGEAAPAPGKGPAEGQIVAWLRTGGQEPFPLAVGVPQAERRRHRRKYAEGDLGEDRSFFFRGPTGNLNLRAQNLVLFTQLAEGVDDATWMYHLKAGDYSEWFRTAIKDAELADEAAVIERAPGSAQSSKAAILAAIRERYTLS